MRCPAETRIAMAVSSDQQLEDLRREVDEIDSAMVDLLAQRMRVVADIARAKRSEAGGRPAIRPGREAIILRRLVEQAGGRFPAGALVRMWRELLAASTRAQAPLSIVAHVPPDQPWLWDLARDHFGSCTPVERVGSAAGAFDQLRRDPARLAVLPLPEDGHGWWTNLLDPTHDRWRVVARLPFAPTGRTSGGALVVAGLEPEPSGEDASVVAIEAALVVGRQELHERLERAGHAPRWLASAASASEGIVHLVELEGWHGSGELRARGVEGHGLRMTWLGGYARPLAVGA